MWERLVVISVYIALAHGSVAGHIEPGTCVCVTGSHVNARHTAGLNGSIAGQVEKGECYTVNGRSHTVDGYTWYHLQHVHGEHAWIAGSFLSVSTSSNCSDNSSVRTQRATYASGLVSQHCLQCICNLESNCHPIDCRWDMNSPSCGYFQIKQVYWEDCGKPGSSLDACSKDKHCASRCIQQYMARYINHYGCAHNCESYARMHNGGPAGCKHINTLGYWRNIQARGCHANS